MAWWSGRSFTNSRVSRPSTTLPVSTSFLAQPPIGEFNYTDAATFSYALMLQPRDNTLHVTVGFQESSAERSKNCTVGRRQNHSRLNFESRIAAPGLRKFRALANERFLLMLRGKSSQICLQSPLFRSLPIFRVSPKRMRCTD